jgi:hypothetical protein
VSTSGGKKRILSTENVSTSVGSIEDRYSLLS